MANDRLYIRCKVCEGYLCLGKFYPGAGPSLDETAIAALGAFMESHLENCQPQSVGFDGPICIVFDSEQTLCDAGGLIGGSGNLKIDRLSTK